MPMGKTPGTIFDACEGDGVSVLQTCAGVKRKAWDSCRGWSACGVTDKV
jgi:hypothetical protein